MSPEKPGPVSEHRESDDHQSKDAHRDNRFRCSIHRCLQPASGRRDAARLRTVVHRVNARQLFRPLFRNRSDALGHRCRTTCTAPAAGRAFRQSAGCRFSLFRCPRATCRRGFEARRPPASAAGVAAHVQEIPRQSPWDCAATDPGGLGMTSVRMRTLLPSIRRIDRPGRVVRESDAANGRSGSINGLQTRRRPLERCARIAACQTVYVRGDPRGGERVRSSRSGLRSRQQGR